MKLLGVSGSLRGESTNTLLLQAFQRHAPVPVHVEIFEDIGHLPPFNPDTESGTTPPQVLALARKVGEADGLILASPEYAHGIPGALKNALDWLVSRFEVPGKPVMLAHASTRGHFLRDHLSEVLRAMSVRLYSQSFEIHLVSKRPHEATAMLDADHVAESIQRALIDFATFVRSPA